MKEKIWQLMGELGVVKEECDRLSRTRENNSNKEQTLDTQGGESNPTGLGLQGIHTYERGESSNTNESKFRKDKRKEKWCMSPRKLACLYYGKLGHKLDKCYHKQVATCRANTETKLCYSCY